MAQRYGTGDRILLTGGAGFVGSHLSDALLARGAEVVIVDNFVTGSRENIAHLVDEPRFTLVEADVIEGLPVTGRFDAVLHFASPASPTDFEKLAFEVMKVNSAGTFHCLELAREQGARLVLASTSEAYGDPEVHPQPETYRGNVNPVGPRSVYDEAKRFAEAAAAGYRRIHDVDTGIVRIFNTYGPRMRPDDGRAIPTFVSQALAGAPITVHGTGGQTRSICYVSDLVDGILAMLDSNEPGPVNLGSEHELTMRELAETIVELTGSRSTISYLPRPTDDPELRRPDLTRARELLNFAPAVSPADGLARTIEWFASHSTVGSPTSAL
ncbi:NAD-dependent epimerase/dehydratase family protein [Cryptosporangium sp. NPDC048952]|uniref:NAD-dependent epimerase/dehydratase family protein n=1 Tax=Cryptosporangium sp. NPDC048952 TaxID=3363961 RepID=UPI0037127B2D